MHEGSAGSDAPRRGARADERFARRTQRGDAEAFEQLVRTHWSGLVAYARRMTRDPDAAKDAVQETLTRLWEGRGGWVERGNERAYLYRAVRNRVIDLARHRRFRDRLAERVASMLPGRARSPEDDAEQSELGRLLDRAINDLPERRREVFVLAHLRDLSYQEIAAVMGVAQQTVANHMSLALRDLRRTLGGAWDTLAEPDETSPSETARSRSNSAS